MSTTGSPDGDADAAAFAAELRGLPFTVRLGLARSPTTRPGDLSALYEDSRRRSALAATGEEVPWRTAGRPGEERALIAALAANPNAPPRVLAAVAPEYPNAFCANPVTPLLLLEVPDFLDWMSAPDLGNLLRRGDAPAPFVVMLAAHSQAGIRDAARLHVARAGDAGPDWRAELRQELTGLARRQAADDSVARTTLGRIVALGVAPPWLRDAGLPKEAGIALLAPDLRPALRVAVLSKARAERAESLSVARCFALARAEGRGDVDLLRRFAESVVWTDRLGVALNPAAPRLIPDAFGQLCDDGNRYVRAAGRARVNGEEPLPWEP